MKKICKNLAALGLVLAMGLSLTACDNISAIMGGGGIDAVAYIQGQLDEMYLGKFDPEYLKMVEIDEAEAQETYDNNVAVESDFFIDYFEIEYPTDEYKARLAGIYKEIYKKADYTVVSSAKQDDGSYSVKVTVRPMDIIHQFNEAAPAAVEEFNARYEDVDTDAMTDEEFDDWYQNTYDVDYQNTLADLLESLVPSIGYLEEKSIAVQIEEDPADGYLAINDESLSNLDALIIDYN